MSNTNTANPAAIEPPESVSADLIAAIAAAMGEAGEVTKSSVNKDQGYKFASAEAILAAVRKPLLARGVILTAEIVSLAEREITSRNNARGSLITIEVEFTFRGHDSQLTIGGWRGQGQDYGDKALGKAYTNAVKTFIRTQWLLPTEHDDPEASDPGERAGAQEIPAWARASTEDRKKAMVAALGDVFGVEAVKAVGQNVASQIGYMPDGFVGFALALVAAAEQQASAAEQARAAQDQVAETPEPAKTEPEESPADPDPDPAAHDEAPEPGSIEPPELPKDPAKAFGTLKAAGCLCEDPIGIRNESPVYDDACPIRGHAIPF